MTNRMRCVTTLGSCAAMALLAGTAMAQSRDMSRDSGMHQDSSMQSMRFSQTGDWKSARSLPTSSDVVLAGKTHDGRDVNVIFTQGRLTSAEVDNNLIDPNRVQMKGERIRIIDRDGQSNLVTFTLPRHLARHSGMRGDRFADQGFRDQRVRDQSFRDTSFQDTSFQDKGFQNQGFRDQSFRTDRTFQPSQQFRSQDQQFRSTQRPMDRSFQTDRFRTEDRFYTQPQRSTFQEQRTPRVYGTDFDNQPMQLGISMSDVSRNELSGLRTNTVYNSGIRVERVHSGTAAERAGLQPGDIIVQVDNEPASTNVLQRKISQKSAGEPLNLRIVRNDRERNLSVRIDSQSMQTFGLIDPWQSAAPPVQPEMPNIDQPGPYTEYRPTRPDWTNINRDAGMHGDRYQDTRFRDDRFYGTDLRDDRYGVTEYRTERWEFDAPPPRFREDRMHRDNRFYRTEEFRDDSFDTHHYGPRSDRMHFESDSVHGTYDFDDDKFSTTYHDFGDVHTYDMREGRIYGTDNRVYGTIDHDPDVYIIDRTVEFRDSDPTVRYLDTLAPVTPSTEFDNFDMPNIEHPGPYNIYRPTQPSQSELRRR